MSKDTDKGQLSDADLMNDYFERKLAEGWLSIRRWSVATKTERSLDPHAKKEDIHLLVRSALHICLARLQQKVVTD